jgi:hypothetical protein
VLALVGASTATAVAYVPPVHERLSASLESFGYTEVGLPANYDSNVRVAAVARVTEFPKANFLALRNLNSPFVYLVGGGFGMASTALVPRASSIAPMAHNQYAELATVFGAVGGSVMVVVLILIAVRLKMRARRAGDLATVVLASYLVFLVNSLFANGTAYQPSSASILCLAAYAACAPTKQVSERATGADQSTSDWVTWPVV